MPLRRFDIRQSECLDTLDQIAAIPATKVDAILRATNSELTPHLRMAASVPASSILNIGNATLANPEISRSRMSSHINETVPSFISGTVTFPTVSGNNITFSTGGSVAVPLTLSVSNYAKVLIFLTEAGNLGAVVGNQDASAVNTIIPSPIAGTESIGYVLVSNTGGVINAIPNSVIYQFMTGGGSSNNGLIIEYKNTTFVAQEHRHYLVSLSSASYVATLPAGKAGSVIMFSTFGNVGLTFRLTLNANGAQTFLYNSTVYTSLQLVSEEAWIQVSWDSTGSIWRVDNTSTFTSAIYGGDLEIPGVLTLTGGFGPGGYATATTAGLISIVAQEFGGPKTLVDTTESTSTTTGSLIIAGGAGVAKNLRCGGDISGAVNYFQKLNLATNDGGAGNWENVDKIVADRASGYIGGVLLPSGKVLMVEYAGNSGGLFFDYNLFNPATGLMEASGPGYGGGFAAGAVLMPNGKVLLIPSGDIGSDGGELKIYNPVTNVYSNTAVCDFTMSDAFNGGILLPNGKVFCIPYDYTGTKVLYNQAANTWDDGPAGPGSKAFFGGVLLPNGKVYCIPYYYTGTTNIYNYSTNLMEAGPAGPIQRGFNGGVLLPNGKVLCIPYDYTGTKVIYNPTTNLMEDGPASSGTGAFMGGVLLPNGKAFAVPHNYTGTKNVYNPITNVWDNGPAGPGSYAFSGGVLMTDGRVICVPFGYAGTKIIYNPGKTTVSSVPWCWHPAFNKL